MQQLVVLLLFIVFFGTTLSVVPIQQQTDAPQQELFCLPGTYTGALDGAGYQVIIPKNWNQILVMYAHGYSETIPNPSAFFSNPYWSSTDPTAADLLLAQGYALAGSTYSAGGWAVKEGLHDTDRLTQHIRSIFGLQCFPKRTILFGVSLGSLVALKKAETQFFWDKLYDGVIAGCALGAGATRSIDLSLQFNIAYDAAFFQNGTGGWPASWGTPQAVNENINYYYDVLPVIANQVSQEVNFPRFEFQRLASWLSDQNYYPWDPEPNDNFLFTDFFFSTGAIAELEKRAGGKVNDNYGVTYTLPPGTKEYLSYFGIDSDPLVAYMNTQNIYKADPKAALYVKQYADFTGYIDVPVITFHTTNDGLVPTTSETVYHDTVARVKRLHNLYQAYASASGHCNFSQQQVVDVVNAMAKWLEKGVKPTANDFPTADGFEEASYSPGPWPYN